VGIAKNKAWSDQRARAKHLHELDRKRQRRLLKQSAHYYPGEGIEISRLARKPPEKKYRYSRLAAPRNFSLHKNPEEMLSFFADIERRLRIGEPIYIDMANVENLSVDSVMYLLAVMHNMRYVRHDLQIVGSVPKSAANYSLLRQCGFFEFVNAPSIPKLQSESNAVHITQGHDTNPQVAKRLSMFIQEKMAISRIQARPLYDTLVELMSNTRQHAYEEESQVSQEWFVFARHEENSRTASFLFLDTGRGIPTTISQSWMEAFRRYLAGKGMRVGSESSMIRSALEGAYRTRTKEPHRGKGLPSIRQLQDNGYFDKLMIISNRGYVSPNLDMETAGSLRGALFYWEMNGGLSNAN
jgi:hypothetical protein